LSACNASIYSGRQQPPPADDYAYRLQVSFSWNRRHYQPPETRSWHSYPPETPSRFTLRVSSMCRNGVMQGSSTCHLICHSPTTRLATSMRSTSVSVQASLCNVIPCNCTTSVSFPLARKIERRNINHGFAAHSTPSDGQLIAAIFPLNIKDRAIFNRPVNLSLFNSVGFCLSNHGLPGIGSPSGWHYRH